MATKWSPMIQDEKGRDEIPEVVSKAIYDSLYSVLYPGQTWERLNERGGFGWEEVRRMAKQLKEREK